VDRDNLWTIMLNKGIRTHLITAISKDSRVITQGVRLECPLSSVLFNLYLDEVNRIWFQKLKLSKYFKGLSFNTLLFADDKLIIADTEDNLQRAVY
jgi:hypothetical protein